VLLIVRYFYSSEAADAAASRAIADDPPGLRTLRASDCLNCHAFDARSIGPSFADIRKRYPYSQASVDGMSRHIVHGASGAWGSIKMPSHPELTMEEAAACITWILTTAADSGTNYYTGTEGSFRVTVPPDSKAKDKGLLVLTASYTDHAGMQGRDAIRIRIH
jgi:cytochrome c